MSKSNEEHVEQTNSQTAPIPDAPKRGPETRTTSYKGYKHRCGYCGTRGAAGRCPSCGSGMDYEPAVIEGARDPHLIIRWLASRDRAWTMVAAMRVELEKRRWEDYRNGLDPNRFDGIPDEMELAAHGHSEKAATMRREGSDAVHLSPDEQAAKHDQES